MIGKVIQTIPNKEKCILTNPSAKKKIVIKNSSL
jgi:hypothetical protein